jgi:hypothetical protein
MTLAASDRRRDLVGHDGRSYPCRSVAMVDRHIRRLTKLIRQYEGRDPIMALGYERDRDQLLDRRLEMTTDPNR